MVLRRVQRRSATGGAPPSLPVAPGGSIAGVATTGRVLSSPWLAALYSAAVSTVLVCALGRALGPEGFGTYSYAISWAVIWAVVQDGGFRTLLFREGVVATEAAPHPPDTLMGLALGHVASATLLGLAATGLIPSRDRAALVAAVGCLGLTAVGGLVSARLKAAGEFRAEAAWQASARSLTAACVIAVLLLPNASPSRVLLGMAAGLVLALGLPTPRRQLRWPRFAWHADVYRSCAALLAIDAASAVYFRIDMVVLRHLAPSAAEVGLYAAAHRFVEAAALLAVPAAQVGFRALRLRCQQPRRFRQLLVGMLAAMLVAAAGAAFAGRVLAEPALRLAFGPEFTAASRPLVWLLASLLFMLPNAILTQGMIAINRERAYARSAIVAAVVSCALNLWLVPLHGAVGAAWAALATEACLCVQLVAVLWRWVPAEARS